MLLWSDSVCQLLPDTGQAFSPITESGAPAAVASDCAADEICGSIVAGRGTGWRHTTEATTGFE